MITSIKIISIMIITMKIITMMIITIKLITIIAVITMIIDDWNDYCAEEEVEDESK